MGTQEEPWVAESQKRVFYVHLWALRGAEGLKTPRNVFLEFACEIYSGKGPHGTHIKKTTDPQTSGQSLDRLSGFCFTFSYLFIWGVCVSVRALYEHDPVLKRGDKSVGRKP